MHRIIPKPCDLIRSFCSLPKLGPPEVSFILRKNEQHIEVQDEFVKDFSCNQLASNQPIEDRLIVSKNRLTTGMTFGVFDGHGGSRMAQVISQRLPAYLALSVLPSDILESYVGCTPKPPVVERVFSVDQLSEKQYELHRKSLHAFAESRFQSTERLTTSECLSKSFEFLDTEVSREIHEIADEDSLTMATQGCVASVAHVVGKHLFVASTGDCRAVLGIQDETGRWVARDLNKEHSCDNVEEIQRILSEHPPAERNNIIRDGRLLGNLAPFRAFGDFMYKWSLADLKRFLVPLYGPRVLPANYQTPPYLTAKPEVTHHILSARDKFLIIATDGVWEMLNSNKAVQLVGQFMQGIQAESLFRLPKNNLTLGEINRMVRERKVKMLRRPEDTNAATHVIRHALGSTEYGFEHKKLATYLGLPARLARNYRDDMSLIVVFFDTDKLKESDH